MRATMTSSDDHAAAPPEWEAIARYLAGESPDAEAEVVRAWLDAHPGDAALVRALDGALDRLVVASASEIDVEDALQRVADRRDEPDVLPINLSTSRDAIVVGPRDGALFLQAADGTAHRYDLATRTLVRLPVGGIIALLDADDGGRLYAMSVGPAWWPEQRPMLVIDPATGAVQQRWPPSDVDGLIVRDGWIYGSAEYSTAAFWRLPVAAAR